MVDKKYLFRLALNQPRHTLPMARSQHKRLQDQQVQRALQQGDSIVVILLGSHPTQILLSFGSDVNPKEDFRKLDLFSSQSYGDGQPRQLTRNYDSFPGGVLGVSLQRD